MRRSRIRRGAFWTVAVLALLLLALGGAVVRSAQGARRALLAVRPLGAP